jgi:lipoyl(octanoyl) transferase
MSGDLTPSWSLVVEPVPLPGARNMAVDEHLFHLAQAGPRTFLRFYRWERPTVSLGYSQEADKVADLDFCRRNGVAVVRRMTGGKLVLHHREVTYAVASSDTALFRETVRDSYRLISRALLAGLELLGIPSRMAGPAPPSYARGTMPCFAHAARDEIETGGRKIIGSAQKRLGPAFLQHGSVPLENDAELLAAVSRPGGPGPGGGMTSLSEAAGRPVDFAAAVAALSRGFADSFGVELVPFALDPADESAVAALQSARYGAADWTFPLPSGPR